MILIPYRVDVPMKRRPFANWAVIAGIVTVSLLWFSELPTLTVADLAAGENIFVRMILKDWNPVGLVGHMFLHAGFMHLIGNMLFLWVFGNAVCAKLSNIAYPFVFIGLGIAAGAAHLMASDGAAIGASGAVNGIVGMFVVLYPLNNISCAYFVWIFYFIRFGTFAVSSFWMVLLWLAFDIFGLVTGGSGVAYAAHLGGFAAGFVFMVLLLKTGIVRLEPGEQSLFHMLGMQASPRSRIVRGEERPAAQPRTGLAGSPFPPASPPPVYPARPAGPASRPAFRPGEPQPAGRVFGLRCPCGNVMRISSVHSGKRGRCPSCQRVFTIPFPPD